MKQKDDSVSIAKAFGIILMVIGHSGCPDWMHHFLSMFHMPLFFFLSGYCFKTYYFDHKTEFIKKRLIGLYLPYIKWSLLFLLLHNVFYKLNIYNPYYGVEGEPSYIYSVTEYFRRALRICLVMDSHEWLLGGFWFLRDLLAASVISLFAMKIIKNNHLIIVLMITIAMGLKYLNIHPSELVGRVFLDSAFFITGFQIHKRIDFFERRKYIAYPCFLIVVIGSVFSPASLAFFEWNQIIQFYVCAVSGTMMVLLFSKWLCNKYIDHLRYGLVYVGNNTMPILTWHMFCFKLISIIIVWVRGYPFIRIAEIPTISEARSYWLLYVFVGLAIPIYANILISRRKAD